MAFLPILLEPKDSLIPMFAGHGSRIACGPHFANASLLKCCIDAAIPSQRTLYEHPFSILRPQNDTAYSATAMTYPILRVETVNMSRTQGHKRPGERFAQLHRLVVSEEDSAKCMHSASGELVCFFMFRPCFDV